MPISNPPAWLRRLREVFVVLMAAAANLAAAPLELEPSNPAYARFNGKPMLLIGSGEHYGGVIHKRFDYLKYFDTLKADDLNLTRTFVGPYVEPAGAFNITDNTLGPSGEDYICAWARSSTPGAVIGGNKFDLNQWDEAFFKRLKDFTAQAARRGIIVEINLFCPFYDDKQWAVSPFNAANNINSLGHCARTNVYTLDKANALLFPQRALVKKITRELNAFDNIYYEVCNEPYFGGVTMEWQHHIAELIVETEKKLPKKHLISRNVANGAEKITNPHPAISIYNFHYATPPDAVAMNRHLRAIIGDNETGFKGTNDLAYRREAWEFILAGGGLFNHLDYSFTAAHPDGTYHDATGKTPGGGGPPFRRQMRALAGLMRGLNFTKMQADRNVFMRPAPAKRTQRAFSEPGKIWVLYLGPSAKPAEGNQPPDVMLALPPGQYTADWMNPVDGRSSVEDRFTHSGGTKVLPVPAHKEDIVLTLRRKAE